MDANRKISNAFPTLLFLLCLCSSAFSQGIQFDSILANKVDSVFRKDQLFRIVTSPMYPKRKLDSIEKRYSLQGQQLIDSLRKLQKNIDYSNYRFIDSIISNKGYPGKSIVGAQRMDYAAMILLHSPHLQKHIDLLEKAGKNKEINAATFALITDRHRLNTNRKQLYGTQVVSFLTNGNKSYIWPIKKPKKVNAKRQEIGLGKIESYSKLFGIEYSSKFKSKRYLNKQVRKESHNK